VSAPASGFVSFLVGAGCRYFDIPVGSPPVLPGALLVVAMTLGYSSTDRLVNRSRGAAATRHLCGGPTGQPAETAALARAPSQPGTPAQ
jgi:XapX domain-containing protein